MSSHPAESLLPKHEAFLRREPVDRPLLGAWIGGYFPADQFPRGHGSWRVGQQLDPGDVRFESFREDYEVLYKCHREADDDFFYIGSAYWGVPWLEAILGCPIRVGETNCWAESSSGRPGDPSSLRSAGEDNPWVQCLLQFTEELLDFAEGRFPVCPAFLRGPGDAVAALTGPEATVMGLVDGEAWVGQLLDHCATARLDVLRRLQDVIPPWCGTYAAGGYPSKLWSARTASYYQDDFAAQLNPQLFAEFLLPEAQKTKPQAEIRFIHLHSGCLYMLDALLADDTFSVIEVNLDHPGSSSPLEVYLPALRRVQQADRPLLLWGKINPSEWQLLQQELEPAGLSVQPIVEQPEEISSYRWQPTRDR